MSSTSTSTSVPSQPAKKKVRRNQYSVGTPVHPKKGPRRSRNIMISTLSGPAATCFSLDTVVGGLHPHPETGALGLRLRTLYTQSSRIPVALVLVGTSASKPSTVPAATWRRLEELRGWEVTTLVS